MVTHSGNDTAYGTFGDDVLYGGAGNDYLLSSEYNTGDTGRMYRGAGNDLLSAGDLVGSSYGGKGADEVIIYFDLGGEARGGQATDLLTMHYIGSSLDHRPRFRR